MPNPINSLGTSFATQSASGRPSAKLSEKSKAPATPGGESVSSEIGSLRQSAMASSGDFDREKVESIKQAISEGKYVIDSRRIAENFFTLERSLYGISSDADGTK